MDQQVKSKFLTTLSAVNRQGIDSLVQYLEKSDFFTAPASTKFHAAFEGGLAEHSWSVYRLFEEKVKTYKLDVPEESVIICGLLHDICKTNVYKKGKKNVKEPTGWVEKEVWEYKDSFSYGHGEKSVYMIERHIKLTDLEAMTIRWHMGFSEPKELWRTYDAAREQYPSVIALYIADIESAFLAEIRSAV